MSFKLKVDIKTNIQPTLKSMQQKIDKIPQDAYKFFVKETPIRSGNARRNTKLKNKKEIVANYPYAQRLDEGYSKQSPQGMTEPTMDYVVDEFIKIMTGKK
jgi:hypothetical protein